jgi:hypothetical protein
MDMSNQNKFSHSNRSNKKNVFNKLKNDNDKPYIDEFDNQVSVEA